MLAPSLVQPVQSPSCLQAQSILSAIGSSIKALSGKSNPCVLLCIDKRYRIVGLLATESILRSHSLSRASPSPQATHRVSSTQHQPGTLSATPGVRPRSSSASPARSAIPSGDRSSHVHQPITVPPAKKQLTLFQALGNSLKQKQSPANQRLSLTTPCSATSDLLHSSDDQVTPTLCPSLADKPGAAWWCTHAATDPPLLGPSTHPASSAPRCSTDPPRDGYHRRRRQTDVAVPGLAPERHACSNTAQPRLHPHQSSKSHCDIPDGGSHIHPEESSRIASGQIDTAVGWHVSTGEPSEHAMPAVGNGQVVCAAPTSCLPMRMQPRHERSRVGGGRLARMHSRCSQADHLREEGSGGGMPARASACTPESDLGRVPLSSISNCLSTHWTANRASSNASVPQPKGTSTLRCAIARPSCCQRFHHISRT